MARKVCRDFCIGFSPAAASNDIPQNFEDGTMGEKAVRAEIRRLYEETTTARTVIGRRFEIEPSEILRRAKDEGWKPRPKTKATLKREAVTLAWAAHAATNASAQPQTKVRRAPDKPEERIKRLFHLIDIQLDNLEKLMTSGDPLTAEDEVRKSRAINTVVGNLEKVTSAEAALNDAAERANGGNTGDRHLKAEKLRRDIAQRLERLNAQWNAGEKPK